MRNYILSCESTVDVPYAVLQSRNIPVLFYTYSVDKAEYIDDMGRDPAALPRFYQWLREGKQPLTSQLNPGMYLSFFEEQLQKGDLLHIAFGSGMSGSVNNARIAAALLKEKYPARKLIVLDSTCSSSGYGMLVDDAADLRDQGASIEEAEAWLLENRTRIHHQFFSTDLTYFRRSGRMTGAAARIATVLNICPMMRLDDRGKIIAYRKVRGKRRAMLETAAEISRHTKNGRAYSGKCWICHSDCPEAAEQMREVLCEQFPAVQHNIRIYEIGTIIAAHCGPGTVAVFFHGDEREAYPPIEKKAEENCDTKPIQQESA